MLLNIHYVFSGLDRFEVREKLWADLEETGLAVKKEPYTLRVPRSQRGGEVPFCCLSISFPVLGVHIFSHAWFNWC